MPELGDLARENGRRVQVRERGGRRRVGQVVGGHVDRLHRGDRALAGRGDALLQRAHLGGERRLVADRGGHAPEQRRDLGAGLREAEDVVDEEQHVGALVVAEGLGDGQAGQADAQARAGRLGHLAVDQRGLALGARDRVGLGQVEVAAGLPVLVELLAEVDDLGLDELAEQVVPLAGALADAGEDREAAVAHRDVVDQLHDQHGLADARAAEEAGLAALGVGLEQVDDLDAGLEHLRRRGQLGEGRGQAVDRGALLDVERAHGVHGLADDVEDAAEHLAADRRRDRRAGVAWRSCRAPSPRWASSRRCAPCSRRGAGRPRGRCRSSPSRAPS